MIVSQFLKYISNPKLCIKWLLFWFYFQSMQMLISVILKRSLNYLAEKWKRIDWRINEFSSIASQMDWKVVCCFSCKTTWHILSVCVVWLWTLLHSTLLGSRHGRKINCLNESRPDGINSSSSSSSSCAYPSPTYTNLLILYINQMLLFTYINQYITWYTN